MARVLAVRSISEGQRLLLIQLGETQLQSVAQRSSGNRSFSARIMVAGE